MLSIPCDCFFQRWLSVFADVASQPQLQGTGAVPWWDSDSLVRVLPTCGHQIHGAGRVWSERTIKERHRVHWPWLRDEGRRIQLKFTAFLVSRLFLYIFCPVFVIPFLTQQNFETNIKIPQKNLNSVNLAVKVGSYMRFPWDVSQLPESVWCELFRETDIYIFYWLILVHRFIYLLHNVVVFVWFNPFRLSFSEPKCARGRHILFLESIFQHSP